MLLQAKSTDRVLVLNKAVFTTAISRERKRAERAARHVLVVVVSNKTRTARASFAWARAVAALARVKRPSDWLGWIREGTQLGIVVPDVPEGHLAIAEAIPQRFQAALAAELGASDELQVSTLLDVEPDRRDSFGATRPVARAVYPLVKRACDILGSASGLLVLSPILLAVAAIVKLTSRGPVLFRQSRVGHRERPFTMLKFRTMCVDADSALHQQYVTSFISGSVTSAGETAAPFKILHDPRVTPVGAILRKTSLDELPQLWNVLRGEMSLVGPRPPIAYEVRQYAAWHRRRVLEVKPGLTGLWQVTGRSCTTFDQMVRLDLQYAKTCSLWCDLKILAATPAAVISGKGAR